MLCTAFARGRITLLRRTVTEHARAEGLTGRGLEDFVLAANEIVTNAVLHGGGHGRLRLWSHAGRLWCEVSDEGPGLPAGWMGDGRPPEGLDFRGRGAVADRHAVRPGDGRVGAGRHDGDVLSAAERRAEPRAGRRPPLTALL
ncbi:ATP-binding protein [Nonomuraea salmonea]|uniref:ATP-binding protein n=1 Tax=Nonomuraea salmonea TaxID=46181 RepID=UPI002FE703E1